MDLNNLPTDYTIAEGPEGLAKELDNLLVGCKQSQEFAAKKHYILYQLGAQRSWIEVNTSQIPFHFDYYDTFGRAATKAVKETIARFLWDKCGEKERFMRDEAGRE